MFKLKGIINVAGKVLKSVALGVSDSVPLVSNIKANIQSEVGFTNKGKIDYLRLAAGIGTVILIIALLMGKITTNELKELLKILD